MTTTVSGTTGASLAALATALVNPPTLGTAQATTSGTSIDFTGIPSWVKRITVMVNGVSTSGTSPVQMQIGSGSVDTTGYNGTFWFSGGGGGTFTTGIGIRNSSATDLTYGHVVLTHMGSNLWCASVCTGLLTGGLSTTGGATRQLAGVLDRIRLTTVAGTDTFDAGSVNILYE